MVEDGDDVEGMIRRAIGGDASAISWFGAHADTASDPAVIVMAALIDGHPDRIGTAMAAAATSRDRQVVAIAAAHLKGQHQLVDALARDHLADHPGSLMVAWIAAGGVGSGRETGHS